MRHKIFNNFIDAAETAQLVDWVTGLGHEKGTPNHHLSELSKSIKGTSIMFDISNTELTNYITEFQSISEVRHDGVPDFIDNIIKRIASKLNIPADHVFLQAVDMAKGGSIQKHYDASLDGYVNYKCNISVLAQDYEFCIDEETLVISQSDMYCFEASLYKHWTPSPFTSRRVMLSFGFILPYELLNRDENDPRVRLSKRIKKYFQG
jgi:hypothetical protein